LGVLSFELVLSFHSLPHKQRGRISGMIYMGICSWFFETA